MASTQTDQSGTRHWELLGNRNFVLLWCAYGVSAIGDHLSEMAILKTQNAASVDVDVTPLDARMTFLFFLPFLLFSPLTGWLADRLERRSLMIAADITRAVLMLGFASLIAWTTPLGTWGPFLPLVAVGTFAALFSPARSALLPTLIRPDQLIRANGLISGLGIVATMIALVAGGYLAQHYAPRVAFRLDAATFVVSALILWMLVSPTQRRPETLHGGWREFAVEITQGLRYVGCHRRVIELLMVIALVWFCGPLVKCVIPAVVRDVYGGSYQDMSGYRAFLGIGFILGALTLATLGHALRSEIAITWGLMGIGASVAVFALSCFLPFESGLLYSVGAVGVVGAGMFGVTVMASIDSLLQRIIPDRFRGRVFGVKEVICTATLLLATGLLGVPTWTRVDRWVGWILAAVAVLVGIAGVSTVWVRLRRSPFGAAATWWLHFGEFVATFWWRMKRVGPCTVPHNGPVIVTAHHCCSIDPLLLLAACPYRYFGFMVAAEYMQSWVPRKILGLIDCIPVRREIHDTGAMKRALRHLRAGKALGMFPYGRIVMPGERAEPKEGVALLALKTGATVIPANIQGVDASTRMMHSFFTRHHARVRFGPPVDLSDYQDQQPDRETLRKATKRIIDAIDNLDPTLRSSNQPLP